VDAIITYQAYDVEAHKLEKLASLAPAQGREDVVGAVVGDINIGQAAWSPTMDRALVSTGSVCSTIALLKSNGYTPLPVEIKDGGRSWRLDSPLIQSDVNCPKWGRAGGPSWSPDGEQIAFFASPQAIGLDGPARLNQPWNLYLTKSAAWTPRAVVSNVAYASSIEWSPDGRWLAFTGGLRGREWGLWLLEATSGGLQEISKGNVTDVTWSPNGKKLAVVYDPPRGEETSDAQVWLIDIANLVD
jgi:Tol biopolymer transport system component